MTRKILKYILFSGIGIVSAFLLLIFGYYIYTYVFHDYYKDLKIVKNELTSLKDVEQVNISANEDITLEEMCAHLYLTNNREIIIYDVRPNYSYGSRIVLDRIGHYTFLNSSCQCTSIDRENGYSGGQLGFGSSLGFNGKTIFGVELDQEISDIKELVNSYNEIVSILDSMPHYPDWIYSIDSVHYGTNYTRFESFFSIVEDDTSQHKGVFNSLYGIDNYHEMINKLNWIDSCCLR